MSEENNIVAAQTPRNVKSGNTPYWLDQILRGALGGVVGAYLGSYVWVVIDGFPNIGVFILLKGIVGAFLTMIYPIISAVLFGLAFGIAEAFTRITSIKLGIIWYIVFPLMVGPFFSGWVSSIYYISLSAGLSAALVRFYEAISKKVLNPFIAALICGGGYFAIMSFVKYCGVRTSGQGVFDLNIKVASSIIFFTIILFQRTKGGIENEF